MPETMDDRHPPHPGWGSGSGGTGGKSSAVTGVLIAAAVFTGGGYAVLDSLVLALAGTGALLVGVGAIAIGVSRRRRSRVDSTMGTVTATGTTSKVTSSGEGVEERHYPIVDYEYTVDGEPYENDALYPSSRGAEDDRTAAEAVAGEYTPGETVTVYYDSTDPEKASLSRRQAAQTWQLYATPLVGLLLLLGAGVASVVGV